MPTTSKTKAEPKAPKTRLSDLTVQLATRIGRLPHENEFRRWAEAALAGFATERCNANAFVPEITIRIVDEDESETLNKTYRHRSGPTNVLSFPAYLPEAPGHRLLGDIAICAPVIIREADEQNKPATAHWAHMVVHGVLHLLGYDHQNDSEAEIMERLEIRILASLGYRNPYQIKSVFNDS